MKAVAFVLTLFFTSSVFGQNHAEDIKAVINTLFKSMKDADSIGVQSVFMPEAIMQTIVSRPGSENIVRHESVSRFAGSIGKQKKGALNEEIEFETVKADPPLAFVWTPYRFYFNGSFSHSGVNTFCLVQTSLGWKIQYIIDTRKK